MYDEKMFKETFAAIKASEDTLTEVLKMTTKKRRNTIISSKRVLVAIITAVLVVALSVTAMAYSGLLGWIFVDRDQTTQQHSETAQNILNDFTAIMQGQDIDAEDSMVSTADDLNSPENIANNAASWLADQIEQGAMVISEFAGESKDGIVTYYFSPGDDPIYYRSIRVEISADGLLYGIDFRAAYPYPQPENCPEEYTDRATYVSDGKEHDVFYQDLYLSQAGYPDSDAYRALAEPAAFDAMTLLVDSGFINADLNTIEVIYFQCFNGGAAWVDVLMENGDNYCLFLQPDDFRPLGFMLFTPERLACGDGNAALFEALRNGTVEEYWEKQRESYANGVG